MCVPSVDEGKSPPIPYVYVNSSGSVKNYRPMQVVLACSLEMYAFPFDKQNCSLTFRSWLHSGLFPAYSKVVEKTNQLIQVIKSLRNSVLLQFDKIPQEQELSVTFMLNSQKLGSEWRLVLTLLK